jgi:cobalt-zinc-cadmium efflux system outer membrane protein
VSLQQALAATLERSPQLATFSWDVRASEARVIQAGLRPNPELSINPENFVGSGAFGKQVQYQNTLQLSQLVEMGDKRELRTAAAKANQEQSETEYAAKRVEVLAAVALDFIDAVSDEAEVGLAKLALKQSKELEGAVQTRAKASIGSPLDVKRAGVLVSRAEVAVGQAERAFRVTKEKLAANWGGRGATISSVAGELFRVKPVPSLDTLYGAIPRSPDHRLAVAAIRVQQAEAALMRSRRVSDITLSGAWRQGRNWDDQAAVVGVSFPLKIFDRAQGDIAASEAFVEKSKVNTESVQVRLEAALFGLQQELASAKEQVDRLSGQIIPRTEEALAIAQKGFSQGIYSQLDVLEAQRTLIEVRREHIQAAANYHKLTAELEKLLGASL